MRTHEFLNKYTGKKVDFDGAFGAQCVDLFRQLCKDVVGSERTEGVEGAEEFWTKYDSMPILQKKFKKVASPLYADIVLFGKTATNKYGHVAIFICWTNAKQDEMLVFEQDGFNQEQGAHFGLWKTDRVLGYLRW